MKNKKIIFWCSDINKFNGEGNLALKFINDIKKNNTNIKIFIKTFSKKKLHLIRYFFGIYTDRFIVPFCGLFYLWYVYLFKKNYKICYVNYLPLWNFILFAALPPGTIIGPITGGSKYLKKNILNYFVRKILFSFFYKLSIFNLKIRNKNFLFATDLLKDEASNYHKFLYNYVFNNFKYIDKKYSRKYDLIFYLKQHHNKNTNLLIKVAEKLSKNFKIIVIGEKINNKKITSFGKISTKKLYSILQITKYSFISTENMYSLFSIDCLRNGVHIFYHKESSPLKQVKKNMTGLNYNNFDKLIKNLESRLNLPYKRQNKILFKNKDKFKKYFKY